MPVFEKACHPTPSQFLFICHDTIHKAQVSFLQPFHHCSPPVFIYDCTGSTGGRIAKFSFVLLTASPPSSHSFCLQIPPVRVDKYPVWRWLLVQPLLFWPCSVWGITGPCRPGGISYKALNTRGDSLGSWLRLLLWNTETKPLSISSRITHFSISASLWDTEKKKEVYFVSNQQHSFFTPCYLLL